MLVEYLDRYRTTFEMKCEGLDTEQLARRSVSLSTMSLLGLVRHLTAVEDLGVTVDHHGEPVKIRDIVVHMIEEYARHVGHADLLRECPDGRTGQ